MSNFKTMPMYAIEIEAMSRNCSVVVAEPNQLQFDIDDEYGEQMFWIFRGRMSERYKVNLMEFTEGWRSKSGNRHYVITLPVALAVPDRIAMQTMGGSDRFREFAALCCHWAGSPHPILLYKPLPKLLPALCK